MNLEQTNTDHKQVEDDCDDYQNKNDEHMRKVGNYELEETIGEGAFGKVKRGKHTLTGEIVAVKIISKFKLKDLAGDVTKIHREINIFKKLRHKNIIQLYEIFESKLNLFLVIEYCNKGELFDYIIKRKKLTEFTACKLFQNLIEGVEYLHSVNIAHRDLKPENLLLDEKFNLKISDFGLSIQYRGLITTPCGTPSYAPPEMLRGDEYAGEKSDIWSCGIILHAMLCGYLPFSESKEDLIYDKIVKQDYKLPDFLSPSVKDLIKQMLEVNPERRICLNKIKSHYWFKQTEPFFRQGIIIGVHQIPVDEILLKKVFDIGTTNKQEVFGTKEDIKRKIIENKFESCTACYYLLVKKQLCLGGSSISDLQSRAYSSFIKNPSNLVDFVSQIYASDKSCNQISNEITAQRAKDQSKSTDTKNQATPKRINPRSKSKSKERKENHSTPKKNSIASKHKRKRKSARKDKKNLTKEKLDLTVTPNPHNEADLKFSTEPKKISMAKWLMSNSREKDKTKSKSIVYYKLSSDINKLYF